MLRWVDYGQYRFKFRRWVERDGIDTPEFSICWIFNREFCSGRFIEVPGGWHLTGFDMGCDPPPVSFIAMCEWDRLEIINSLT